MPPTEMAWSAGLGTRPEWFRLLQLFDGVGPVIAPAPQRRRADPGVAAPIMVARPSRVLTGFHKTS